MIDSRSSAGDGSDFDMMMASKEAAPAASDTNKITSKMASLSLAARVRQKYGNKDTAAKTSTSASTSAVSGI